LKWIYVYLSMMLKEVLSAPLFLLAQSLCAQQYYNDSAIVSGAADYAKQYYNLKRGNESAIYNGVMHHYYPSVIEGTAYFSGDSWAKGTVLYDNIFYEDMLMRYDLVTDQLVILLNETSSISLSLFSPRVKEFSYSGLKFIYQYKINGMPSFEEGFYQELVRGRVSALCRTTKIIAETINGNELLKKFEEKKKYYLVKDNHTFYITKKKDLLSLFKDKKKTVQEYMKIKKLKFRKNTEKTITAVTELYNKPEEKKL